MVSVVRLAVFCFFAAYAIEGTQSQHFMETTCSTIFENNWEWEDEAGELLKTKILEIRDHRGNTFKESETPEKTGPTSDETTQKTVRDLVFEEMGNFYNKKVKIIKSYI